MQFMVVMRRRSDRFTDEDFKALVAEEQAAARALYMEGLLRQIWYRGDMGGGVLLLEADNLDAAKAAINRLPFVERDMLEITDFMPLKPFGGFGLR